MKKSINEINLHYIEALKGYETLVLGDGNIRAKLALIGEAPGRQEEEQGKPFVGAAGKNLSEFLEILKLKREDIYITNTVKFRPTRPGVSGRRVNRTPSRGEIEEFLPWLKEELEALSPKVVVTLGNTALQALCGKETTIGKVHGQALEKENGVIFPLYHPASVIYNRALRACYLEDLNKLHDWLQKMK